MLDMMGVVGVSASLLVAILALVAIFAALFRALFVLFEHASRRFSRTTTFWLPLTLALLPFVYLSRTMFTYCDPVIVGPEDTFFPCDADRMGFSELVYFWLGLVSIGGPLFAAVIISSRRLNGRVRDQN